MKRMLILLFALTLGSATALRAQDTATEERLNKLSGQIEDLQAARVKLDKQMAELSRELESLREQQNHPSANYAAPEDVKRLAEKIQEVDQKRIADNERILKEIEKLGKVAAAPAPKPPKPAVSDTSAPGTADKGFEYVVQPGDTLSIIAQAYKEKNIKVSVKQILAANPGLDEKKLKVGQKIFIPAPK